MLFVDIWLTSSCKLIELVNDILVFEVIEEDDFDGLTFSSRGWVDDVAEIEEEDETPTNRNEHFRRKLFAFLLRKQTMLI